MYKTTVQGLKVLSPVFAVINSTMHRNSFIFLYWQYPLSVYVIIRDGSTTGFKHLSVKGRINQSTTACKKVRKGKSPME